MRKQSTSIQQINTMTAYSMRNFGASEKALKLRMKSVTSIGKITKAMKMVAASKMKGDLLRLSNGKAFGNNTIEMMFKCDTYMQRRAPEAPASVKKHVFA
jgi:F-type H+-transporting ATPase subunit gamma